MKTKKKTWIVIIVLAVIGLCAGFYFGYKAKKDNEHADKNAGKRNLSISQNQTRLVLPDRFAYNERR